VLTSSHPYFRRQLSPFFRRRHHPHHMVWLSSPLSSVPLGLLSLTLAVCLPFLRRAWALKSCQNAPFLSLATHDASSSPALSQGKYCSRFLAGKEPSRTVLQFIPKARKKTRNDIHRHVEKKSGQLACWSWLAAWLAAAGTYTRPMAINGSFVTQARKAGNCREGIGSSRLPQNTPRPQRL